MNMRFSPTPSSAKPLPKHQAGNQLKAVLALAKPSTVLRCVSIRSRVFVLCSLAVALVVTMSLLYAHAKRQVQAEIVAAFEQTLPAVHHLDQARVAVIQQQLILDRAIRPSGMSDYASVRGRVQRAHHEFEEQHELAVIHFDSAQTLFAQRDVSQPIAAQVHDVLPALHRLQMLQRRAFRLGIAGDLDRARRLNAALALRKDRITERMLTLTTKGHNAIAQTEARVDRFLEAVTFRTPLITGSLVLLMLALSVAISRSITRPLQRVIEFAGDLAYGHRSLNHPHDAHPDEAGQLLRTLTQLDEDLSRVEQDMEHRTSDIELTNERLEAQSIELAVKTHELELARKDADAANHAKSQFLANMSHEIRTPMTAILGYAELLGDDALSPDARRGHLHTIHRNGQHLLTIINDILDLSKIEAGQMTLERIDTQPLDVLKQCAELLKVRAQESGCELRIQPQFPLPATIQSDPVRLRQVLLNLLGNAIKFSPQGAVTAAIAYDPEQRELRFDLIDDGIGMTPEQVGRLFQRFSQADCSTTRRFGGTGLGLTISQRLTEMLGGKLSVQSKPHQGSTFSVVFPTPPIDSQNLLTSDTAPSAVAAPSGALKLVGRILLAEDSPDNQRLLSFILRKAGLDVELAADGQEALDAIAGAQADDQPYDLVLMDVQMPRLDGTTATRAARDHGYAGPIIALTAHAMSEQREQAEQAGFTDYATKPIDREALIQLVAHHLGFSAAQRDAA